MRFPVCRKRRKAKAICRKRFRCLMSGPSKVDRFYCNEWKGKHQSLIFNELLMRIIVFLIAAVAQIAAAVFGLFILLLGLNGFSEREATPALIFFIVLSLASVVGDGVIGVVLANRLANSTKFGVGAAAVVATLSVVILGVVILVAGVFVAFVLANVVHGMK